MLWSISNDCDCRAGSQYDLEEVQRYQETKERVFFEGFVYNTEEEWNQMADYGLLIQMELVKHTIEDMIQCDMTLPKSVIKQ